jgi:hypothetical protein
MDTSSSNDMKLMCMKDNSPTSIHQGQVAAETLSGHMSTASTETLGRSRANADISVTESTTLTKPHFETNDKVTQTSNWLWNIDRPWEGFKPPNAPDFKVVQERTENNTMSQVKRKDTNPPRKQAVERY